MSIYKVNWKGHCYVKAEDLRDAKGTLRIEVLNQLKMAEEIGLEFEIDPTPAKSLKEVSPEWKDCIPYGGCGDVTIEDEFAQKSEETD